MATIDSALTTTAKITLAGELHKMNFLIIVKYLSSPLLAHQSQVVHKHAGHGWLTNTVYLKLISSQEVLQALEWNNISGKLPFCGLLQKLHPNCNIQVSDMLYISTTAFYATSSYPYMCFTITYQPQSNGAINRTSKTLVTSNNKLRPKADPNPLLT